MNKLKVLELFAGIGACSKALERLGIEHEIVDAVEIDKYAMNSFNVIHGTNFETQDITQWDKDIEVDLIMHGSPCQDFSLAGKQAGGDEGSGTRSSLMYETIRIVEKLKPKYVIWENVKNLLSKNHRHNFDAYLETMENLGYTNYYQVLNAKDYGIPQNRERVFTVSILNGECFEFPKKQELGIRLKDILEEEVDEKYYLTNEKISKIQESNFMQERKRIQEKDVCDTLLARDWKDPKCVRIGGIFDTDKEKHQAGSIYDKEGISPTLDAMQGGWRQPSIVEINTYSPYVNKKYENFINKKGYIPEMFNPYNETEIKDVAPTLTAQGDSITKSGTVLKVEEIKLPGAYGRNFGSKGKIQDEICDTLQAAMGCGGGNVPLVKEFSSGEFRNLDEYIEYLKEIQDQIPVENQDLELENGTKFRIRKLTPKECWRLMGFDDEDFEKAEKVNSNTQLYKQARKFYCGKCA